MPISSGATPYYSAPPTLFSRSPCYCAGADVLEHSAVHNKLGIFKEHPMLFTDEFIESLKDDPVRGTIRLCDQTFEHLDLEGQEGWSDSEFSILIEAYALLVEVIESGLLPVRLKYPVVSTGGSEECGRLCQYLREVREVCVGEEAKLRVSALRNRFKTSLSSGFFYEFSQGDLARVQGLVNQLRELIAATGQFEKEHQQRLLRRLEKLQSELHKKVSDLRSEERRVGKECRRLCRSRWSPYH
jgi:hypothetical protein